LPQFWENEAKRSEGPDRDFGEDEPQSKREYLPIPFQHQIGLFVVQKIDFC
jgi:hypothetical protein